MKHKDNARITGFIIAIINILIPTVYNFMHPDITTMRILIMFWWAYLIAIAIFAVVAWKWN